MKFPKILRPIVWGGVVAATACGSAAGVPDAPSSPIVPSPSKTPVILVRQGTALGTLNLDGTGFTKIADIDTTKETGFQWMSSGREVSFFRVSDDSTSQLGFYGLDGSKRLLAPQKFGAGRARVNGDGTWIASVNLAAIPRASITRMRQDGTSRQALGVNCCDFFSAVVDISPDGQQVLYGDDAVLMTLANLATGKAGSFTGHVFSPRFSPDGSRIAFLIDNGSLFVRNVDLTPERYIAGGPGATRFQSLAGWSPDGKSLLLSSPSVSTTSWYVVSAESGESQRLPTEIGTTYKVVGGWSP